MSYDVYKRLFVRLTRFLTRDAIIGWLPVLAALLVHFAVLRSSFLHDDFTHLYSLANLPFLDALRVSAGGHLFYTSKTVMWAVASVFGANPLPFMVLGLFIHLISVRLLFLLIAQLTDKIALAAFGAALWGMSPYTVGTLGWLSVHGQAYATAAILWVLLDIARASNNNLALTNAVLLRHATLLLLAAASFGTGLATVLVFFLVIALWNPLPDQRRRLVGFYSAATVAVVTLYYISMHGADMGSARINQFFSGQFGIILAPLRAFLELVSIGFSALVGGPLVVGKIAFIEESSLRSLAPKIALALAAPLFLWWCIVADSIARRRIFALLLLPLAAYSLIAYARTGGWFAVHPEAHRYHYLAPAIMTIVLCLIFSSIIDSLPKRRPRDGRVLFVVWLALVIVPFYLGPVPAIKEPKLSRQNQRYKDAMQVLEQALRKGRGQDEIYIVNQPYNVYGWGYTPHHFPGLAALFVMSYPDNTVHGARVYFIEESAKVVEMTQAQKGSRIAELIVAQPQRNP